MSTTSSECPRNNNDCVDVDCSGKENLSNSEVMSDSGIDSVASSSSAAVTSPVSEISPNEQCEMQVTDGNIHNPISSAPDPDPETNSPSTLSSISPDLNDATDNLLSLDEFSMGKPINATGHITSTKIDLISAEFLCQNAVSHPIDSSDSSIVHCSNDLGSNEYIEAVSHSDLTSGQLQLDNTNIRILTTSTASLNDHQIALLNTTTTICKSPYSKSAENISVIDQDQHLENTSNSNKLNTEKILTEFANQNSIASATQKITPDVPHQKIGDNSQVLDARHSRIPKELLSQDLGSIVKNVHGIFSSVSGSLKNAYTHRVTTPKPVKTVKPIPNGKIMDDIFEDDKPEELNNANNVLNKPFDSEVMQEEKELSPEELTHENDPKRDMYRLQIESLERVVAEQRKENTVLRERVKEQVDAMQEKDQTFKELEVKMDSMSKRVEQAEREKDAAVMRYASVECAAIEAKRSAEKAAAAERAAAAEVELLNGKLKSAHAEKHRICQMYDDKCHELQMIEREVAKVREDTTELEGRLKWTQSKLRMEMDAYKESAEKAEKLSQQITELEAAKVAAVTNATDLVRAKQLEAEVKESQAALIMCRHENEELERRLAGAAQRADALQRERDAAGRALAHCTAEVERLAESNARLEQEAAELAALRARAALADALVSQLQRESERAALAEEALRAERARAETCARREAAALEHAARLTAQHVAQRARAADHEARAQALSSDNSGLRERGAALEAEAARLRAALADEAARRAHENRVLARKVAELTEEAADANKKLEWEKGENLVLKKKHSSAVKELNRELQRALKRCEQLEAKMPPPDAASTRTGSISSISSGESAPHDERLQNGHADALPHIQIKHSSLLDKVFPKVREPDRQTLIERIVSLQRAAARRSERCEFLEEHSRQLTGELRAKSRLLRHLLCAVPAGAVASKDSDAHKKEIARLGGGAMAAVWGGDPGGMTLELSLEMNKRLQAVLEDALLKNITLKENMDTLGEEIARLKDKKTTTDTK